MSGASGSQARGGRASKPLGLRREVVFFFPTALLLLVLVASFDLLVYRNALGEIEDERMEDALRLARSAAERLAATATSSSDRLERLAPAAVAIAVRDATGDIVARSGDPTPLPPQLLGGAESPLPRAFGPSRTGTSRISALAPFERNGRPYVLQIDLRAERLAAHGKTLGRILALNAVVLGALTLLVLLFMRRLLAPYDLLLEQARRIEGAAAEPIDETEFLIRAFDRALETLAERDEEADDMAALGRTLAPSLESGFMLLDAKGATLSLNELGAELLDLNAPRPGSRLDEVLADHRELAAVIGAAVAERRSLQRHECEISTSTGRRLLGLTVHPLRRDDGIVRGFIVLFADLTEARAEATRQRISTNLSQLGEIAAGVAHEMRNGLGTLKGYLALIETSDEESVRDYLEEMRGESEHLERVLSDFLSFARPGSLRTERLDLIDVVERAVSDPALEASRFAIDTPGASLELSGDRQLLERALRNLLQNAQEAQTASGSSEPIEIALRRDGEIVTVTIDDRGDGLPGALADSLFQPFVSGRADGVGLGLALAHRIATLHEGDLEIVDREEGGARAVLQLPVAIDT